jgi:perosamine synthetase
MPKVTVPVNSFVITEADRKYVLKALEEGWVSSEGPYVAEFEEKLASKFGVSYAVAVSSGTAALDVAVRSFSLGDGFKALVPDHTIISCASSIVNNHGRIIVCDSNISNWNQDVDKTIQYIHRFKPDLVLVSHLYGLPFRISLIKDICHSLDIPILEDAAEMIGQSESGRLCGSLGDISIFSFYPNKHITTGEGGAILTNNRVYAERARYFRNLCFNSQRRFLHNDLGYNYRMSSMQAALGTSQLLRLDEHIKKKRFIGNAYNTLLSSRVKEIFQLPLGFEEANENIYWVYGLVSKDPLKQNKFFQDKLAANGVGTRPFFYPLSKQPCLSEYIVNSSETCKISDHLATYGFYLPSGLSLTSHDISYVAEVLDRVCHEEYN